MFDTDVLKLINELSKKGIYLWEEQGRLKYKCKKEKISEEILNELRVKKAEIVEFLQKCGSNSFPVSPLQSAYLIGEEKNCELGNTNAHYYIEYEASSINIKRLEEGFSNGSSISISRAMVTPSLVTVGEPNGLSNTTLRPRGPSVTLTTSARVFTPRRIPSRAS